MDGTHARAILLPTPNDDKGEFDCRCHPLGFVPHPNLLWSMNQRMMCTTSKVNDILRHAHHTDSRVLWNTISGNSSWVWASRQDPSAR
jgi:hypothetical protein